MEDRHDNGAALAAVAANHAKALMFGHASPMIPGLGFVQRQACLSYGADPASVEAQMVLCGLLRSLAFRLRRTRSSSRPRDRWSSSSRLLKNRGQTAHFARRLTRNQQLAVRNRCQTPVFQHPARPSALKGWTKRLR